VQLHY